MKCEAIRELLEGYTLGTLDEQEQVQVQQHLADCPYCRQLADDYALLASALPDALAATSPLRPSASLRERLLQEAQRGVGAPSKQAKASHSPSWLSPSQDGRVQERSAWRRLSWRTPGAFISLAAVVILLLFLVWNMQLRVALAQERALRAEFTNLVDQQELVLEIVDGRNTVKSLLLPLNDDSDAYGKIFTRPDMPHLVAMAARLPQPPPGQAYHLWLTQNGRPRLVGMMTLNAEGFGIVIWQAEQNGPTYEAAQLLLQPAGSATPSGTPVLQWSAP